MNPDTAHRPRAFTFDLQALKNPVIDEVTGSGWDWQAVAIEPEINGDNYEVEIPIEAGNLFYQLSCDDEQIPPTPQ